jgi:DNA-binding IclR family transcriptional regulator
MSLSEDIFRSELDKRKQSKIEEMVLNFLREKRNADGSGYTVEKIAKSTGLSTSSVGLVLKTSLLYKKWVEHKGVDYFRATEPL